MKYVTKARWISELQKEAPDVPGLTVYEDDEPQFTGLYDARGNALYRVKEKYPIGFRRG